MPVISTEQFIQIADRLAASYGLLIDIENALKVPQDRALIQFNQAYPNRLLVDLTGTGVHAFLSSSLIAAKKVFFSMVVPASDNASLSSLSSGTNLVVSLGTDASGSPDSLVEDVIDLIDNNTDFSDYITIDYPVGPRVGGIAQPFPMTLLSGGVGTGMVLPDFSIATTIPGPDGNNYTLTINQPTSNSAVFGVCWNKQDLVINLPTNSSGDPTETLSQLETDLLAVTTDFEIYFTTGSDLVPAVVKTNFSGAGVGSYAQVLLTPPPGSKTDSADSDVATGDMLKPAKDADENITAAILNQDLSLLDNMQLALVNHFINIGYSGGMVGFMDDNKILVHQNFGTLYTNRTGNALPAANVFRADQIILGTVLKGASTISFTSGTALGSGSGDQTATNFGPQALLAVLVPAGGTLASTWVFTLTLLDSTGATQASNNITFTSGATGGTAVSITVPVAPNKFYSITGANFISGGSNGDKVFITQILERQISL